MLRDHAVVTARRGPATAATAAPMAPGGRAVARDHVDGGCSGAGGHRVLRGQRHGIEAGGHVDAGQAARDEDLAELEGAVQHVHAEGEAEVRLGGACLALGLHLQGGKAREGEGGAACEGVGGGGVWWDPASPLSRCSTHPTQHPPLNPQPLNPQPLNPQPLYPSTP